MTEPEDVFTDSIIVIRPGQQTSRAGDAVDDWDHPESSAAYDHVSVQPRDATEQVSGTRTVTVTRWLLSTRPGVDIDLTARDRVQYGALTLQVVGEVGRFTDHVYGGIHHVEATLQLAEG